MAIYKDLIQELPFYDGELTKDYVRRITPELIDKYKIKASSYDVLIDNINREIRRQSDPLFRVKRSETLNAKGEIITERFGYVKPDIDVDESRKVYTGGTTNPNGQDWLKFKFDAIDYTKEVKDLFTNLKFDKIKPFKKKKSHRALKVTVSDMHVGMSTGNSLFEYVYGADEFLDSLDKVYQSVMEEYTSNGRFDVVIIQDLGDALDGYNGQTTRGGHSLEQNMSNNDCFRTLIKGKLNLINKIYSSDIANKIIIKDTVNCNHSGDFGFMASYAIKLATESIYSNIEYTIHEKFIEHFYYGEHCFIQCHGKDKQYMKAGMPKDLNDKTIKFITQYIERFKIKSKFIHFEKGDLHQIGYGKCKQFDYRNYMSLAPPSNWIQHNCGDGYSGYSLQIIDNNRGEIKHIDYYIDYDLV